MRLKNMYKNFSYFSYRNIQNPHCDQNIIVWSFFKCKFPQRLIRSAFKNCVRGEMLLSLYWGKKKMYSWFQPDFNFKNHNKILACGLLLPVNWQQLSGNLLQPGVWYEKA